MKKLLVLISLSIGCFAASAQPTSFGGITPGQTTREELKSLVDEPNKIGADDSSLFLTLKQPEGQSISVQLRNDVVYWVEVDLESFLSTNELRPALIQKYGQPRIKVGGIRNVICRNQLGASFKRFEGEEELRWPVKNGVQGAIRRRAGKCDQSTDQTYLLRHVDTAISVLIEEIERARKDAQENRRKLGNAY